MKLSILIISIVFNISIVTAQTSVSNKKEFSLKECFEGYLHSVKQRDYDALKTYFTKNDTIQFVDGGGNVTLQMTEYLKKQKEWFADTAWKYESSIISLQEFDYTGIIQDKTKLYGSGWEYKMVVTYVFQKEEGYWRMIADICTEKK